MESFIGPVEEPFEQRPGRDTESKVRPPFSERKFKALGTQVINSLLREGEWLPWWLSG